MIKHTFFDGGRNEKKPPGKIKIIFLFAWFIELIEWNFEFKLFKLKKKLIKSNWKIIHQNLNQI